MKNSRPRYVEHCTRYRLRCSQRLAATLLPSTLIVGLLVSSLAATANAQNVSGYGSMANPYLFLIREPAVQRDLELTDEQQQRLDALNVKFDPTLLSIRNQDDANKRFDELTVETQQQTAAILTKAQQRRLSQIRLRIRGWRSLLLPKLAARIGLSEEQNGKVNQAVVDHDEAVKKLQADIQSGATPQAEAQVTANEKLKEMEKKIGEILTAEQTKSFLDLVGEEFPLNELERVAFNAPGLAPDQKWLNSEPLTMEKLKGKVVALHFFAFA